MSKGRLIFGWLLMAAPLVAQAAPILFEPARVDLGVVQEGKKVRAELRLRNASDRPVVVVRVGSSCGCTVVNISDRVIAPGSFAIVGIEVDTALKRGRVVKTIEAETDQGERAVAEVVMFVRDPGHAKARRSLFAPPCARCHAAPAKGVQEPGQLYRAVCAMCHGDPTKGAYAPALAGLDAAYIERVLRRGLGAAMPAFAASAGGPLSVSQLHALASWLAKGGKD